MKAYLSSLACLGILSLLLFGSACRHTSSVEAVAIKVAPISIEGLRNRSYNATLEHEEELEGSLRYQADLWSYYSDQLKNFALINTPVVQAPEKGFPVLIFGHGFHPEPQKYGVSTLTGKDWRPGDYYRGVPEAFAEQGFLVITPDYRGHNVSEGFAFTQTSYLASSYYAIDVLHLLDGLKDMENIDLNKVYYLGHSMGGDVGLKMLLATNQIKAASLWAPVCASTWEQAIYYGNFYDKEQGKITSTSMQRYMARLDSVLQNLGYEYDLDTGDPIHFIDELTTPLVIHHAKGESSVPYRWSESFAAQLYKHGKTFEFYSYESNNHLFQNETREKAIQRDIAFFNKY